jgi:hypothetical protein
MGRPSRYPEQFRHEAVQIALASERAEGKNHKQALIALARRRITTLWAMLRDRTTYQEPPRPALAPAA